MTVMYATTAFVIQLPDGREDFVKPGDQRDSDSATVKGTPGSYWSTAGFKVQVQEVR